MSLARNYYVHLSSKSFKKNKLLKNQLYYVALFLLLRNNSFSLFTFLQPFTILLETKSRINEKWQHITTNHHTHSVNIS